MLSPTRHRAAALVVLAMLVMACATRTPPAPAKPAVTAKPAVQVPATAATTATTKERTDDEVCQADGYDFSAGSEEYNGARVLRCGIGPGTPCTGEAAHCDGARYMQCYYGRLSMTDCRELCRESGDMMGVTYDGGTCTGKDDATTCTCCDVGEAGCEKEVAQPKAKQIPLSPPFPRGRR